MPPGPGPLVVVLLLGLLLFVAGIHGRLQYELEEEEEVQGGSSFSLPMWAPHVPESGEERREHFRMLKAKDMMRQRRMMRQVPELMSKTDMFELPMRSALNIAQVGMYVVVVRIGTPALPYSLALETANDVTWINCRLRRRKGKHPGRPHVPPAATTMSVDVDGGGKAKVKVIKNWYRPAKSSSWRRFRCSQRACMELPYNTCQGPDQNTSCTYFQAMKDETITSGIYGQEKATVAVSDGTMKKLPGLVIGCSTFEHGGAVDSHDGILSLGNSPASFGIAAASRFGGRLSFCLLATSSSRNASSYLTFGANPAVQGPGTMETPLLYRGVAYGAHVTGIFVGGQPLDIPPEVWDEGTPERENPEAGVVFDTGTSITHLVPAVYDPVTAELDRHLAHLERATVLGFEYCYNWIFAGDGVDPAHNVTIPSFSIEMAGGARLEADAKSIVIPEVSEGVACLGFNPTVQGPSIIGNVLMQEHIWEIDHMGTMLRFRKDKCTDHQQLNKHQKQQHSTSSSSSSSSSSSPSSSSSSSSFSPAA
uniref:Peptidase A1 domain-containing protein n=1 Tax=Oryza punctata TaxID=4537 RepID=A0A0E0L6M7_ORYPU